MSEIDDNAGVTGATWGDQLLSEMSSKDALQVAEEAAAYIRDQIRAQIDDLEAALGQPATPARKEHAARQKLAPPATQVEAAERVRKALTDAGKPLTAKALARRTDLTTEQVKAILVGLGAVQHGLKFEIKAGS